MSTRKTTAVATIGSAAATQSTASTGKSENATIKVASAATTATTIAKTSTVAPTQALANTSVKDKPEMGSNASSSATADAEINDVLESVKETAKTDIKRASSEPKRITRNSPLLLSSPVPSGGIKKDAFDSELTNSESEDGGAVRRSTQIKGRKSLKECRERKSSGDKEKIKEENVVEGNETDKTTKDVKEKDAKAAKSDKKKEDVEAEDSAKDNCQVNDNSTTTSTTAATTTNRLTRKSVAQELAANTRVTRNRHPNTPRPETPPTTTVAANAALSRPRRSTAGKKNSNSISESGSKRKRTDDDSGALETSGGKCIKIEPKDDSEATEDELPPPTIDTTKIKSEPIESDESATEANITCSGSGSSVTRSRGRWNMRKPQQTSLQNSPSTRATRHSKNVSPSPSPTTSSTSSASVSNTAELKRKRANAQTNALKRSSSLTLIKTAATISSVSNPTATPLHVPDEDSKDSMASSSIDELSVTDIKIEKLTSDLADDIHMHIEVEKNSISHESSAIALPLTVETNEMETKSEPKDLQTTNKNVEIKEISTEKRPCTPLASTSSSSSADTVKAASLSPEMVSEGVSEISVKQFYKKPKFLENNLGIEEDPKLGEIVQKVSTGKEKEQANSDEKTIGHIVDKDTTIQATKNNTLTDENGVISDESDDMKEGALRVDESIEEKKISYSEDANSVNTEILSPLVIEDDDESEVEVEANQDLKMLETVETKMGEKTAKREQKDSKQDLVVEIDDDDITMEDSETISMDNNPSVQESVVDDLHVDADMEQDAEQLENKIDMCVLEENDDETNEKTKTECDSIQAKLKVDNENVIENKDEMEGVENDKKSKRVNIDDEKLSTEYSKVKLIHMDIVADGIDLAEAMDTVHSEEEDDTKLCIDEPEEKMLTSDMENIENIEDDEVVAKIDAELKFYDDLEKSKILDQKSNIGTVTADKYEDHKNEMVKFSVDDDTIKTNCMPKDQTDNECEIVPTILLKNPDNVNKVENKEAEKESPVSSTTESPTKSTCTHKEDDSTSMKSGQSTDGSSWVTLDFEHDEEALRQKEQHLQNLGLLTHEAAEKRRQEFIQNSVAAEATRAQQQHTSGNGKRNGKSNVNTSLTHEYTGTLKTVIKINRNTSGGTHTSSSGTSNGRKNNSNGGQHTSTNAGSSTSREAANGNTVRRQSLKITFQKGRGRGQGNTDRAADHHSNGEDAYYTIQNENEDSSHSEGYDTLHHHHTSGSISHKKDEKEEILIPEKASSFKFHPGRLCDDQCFYCSGKFGLYDTPCHVGQIKTAERQQKILANEEKLTVDSCLCDACFRHVDRRANVPSYKKRTSVIGHVDNAAAAPVAETTDNAATEVQDDPGSHKCLVPDCANPAAHSLRRKCIRKSVKKFLLNFDMPTGSTCVWLCQAHYDTVIQCSGCVLCKRRLGKNHMYHITSDTDRLEKALSEMGIPVQLGIGTAVCKLCRYFANLLMKPPESNKSQKAEFVKNYRKRLLQFHNIHDGSNEASEVDDEDINISNLSQSDVDKSMGSSGKTPQKQDKTDTAMVLEDTTIKNLPSPAESSGSSIECLGVATTMIIGDNDKDSGKKAQQKHIVLANESLTDYDVPATLSTDSNSSSSPMSPTHSGSSGKQQMSKLKAILQSSNSSSNVKTSTSSTGAGGAAADISNVLRANPNISMRELFPGEEDLGLNFKVPFGSSTSQRTPEGWTRVQTFLQYDEATRRLWEDLQKPYGNQSSFLRHLILLEKYYRNGDLVLSPNASSNASVYTQTVRQRLTSYDQGHCGGLVSAKPSPPSSKRSSTDIPTVEITEDDDEPKGVNTKESKGQQMEIDIVSRDTPNAMRPKRSRSDSVDKLTKQLSSNAVTIIARPKPHTQSAGDSSPQKSLLKEKSNDSNAIGSTTLTVVGGSNSGNTSGSSSSAASNSRSILKTNLLGMNKAVEILPISASSSASTSNIATTVSTKPQSAHNSSSGNESKQQKILDLANKLLDTRNEAEQAKNNSGTSLLTSPPELVSLQRRATSGTAPSSSNTTTTSAPTLPTTVSSLTASLINYKRTPAAAKSGNDSTTASHRPAQPNAVVLPDTLTARERQQRNWRPTLMPVEENLHLIDKAGPLYQTADGRRLPALVQVLSGGKPFLISIFDYNRMCILRREKLLRDQMLKTGKNPHDTKQSQTQQQQQQQQQQQITKVATSSNVQAANFSKHAGKQQQQHHLQQQQQHHHQQQQQQQAAQQQLIHLQMMQLQKQTAMKAPNRYSTIAPKPTSTATTLNGGNGPATIAHTTTTNVNVAHTNSNIFTSPMLPLLTNAFTNPNPNPLAAAAAAAAKLNSNAWLWNFPESAHMLNGNMVAAQNIPKLPQLLHKGPQMGGAGSIAATITSKQQQQQHQQQQQQMLIDNTLMSKIPKTLTVIPQHKLMGNSSTTANVSHKE